MLSALFGYAVGTLQILLLDWFRARNAHARQLRLLRADMRNAATYTAKFNWSEGKPVHLGIPRPPRVSPAFERTLSETDFRLTDEHEDDNTQQSLLIITDGFQVLDYYLKKWGETVDQMQSEKDPTQRKKLRDNAIEYMQVFDERANEVHFLIAEAIKDLDRRISEARIWRQLNRPVGQLPPGSNPLPLQPNDPRVAAFLEQRSSNTA